MIYKTEYLPDQEFDTLAEMHRAIKENFSTISDAKKAQIKMAEAIEICPATNKNGAVKGLNLDAGFIYPVINTTKYMDSHNDVHLDGIWDRSLKDVQGKIYYVANHKIEVGQVIAYPQDVKVMVQEVKWKDLGYNISGSTQALMFKVNQSKIRMKEALDIVSEKISIQHSVRMQYVKFSLAINSNEADMKAEKANWDKHISKVSNKDRANESGFFFAIEEAKIVKEGSMVLHGSNDITPMLLPKHESTVVTHTDPPAGNQKPKWKQIY